MSDRDSASIKESVRKRPGRPRSIQSHQAMLQATLKLLAEVGFNGISIDAIAARAGVSKTTIYRRYTSKEELIADAIESVREEIAIPDTGNFQDDLDAIVENAAQIVFSPLGRETIAAIVSSASTNSQFAQIYQTKYLQPRRKIFAIVLERAKIRNEIPEDMDSDLVFDTMSGIMLYALISQQTSESWQGYVCRTLKVLFDNN